MQRVPLRPVREVEEDRTLEELRPASHEVCGKHAEISKPFAGQKPTPEQAKLCRDSIWKMTPKNVCVTCHMVQGHHDSMTPKELQKP
jgi:hypothetical protein